MVRIDWSRPKVADINPKRPPQTAFGWSRLAFRVCTIGYFEDLPDQNWLIDALGLAKALAFLGVKAPVEIVRHRREKEWPGAWALPAGSKWNTDTTHRIIIDPRWPPNFAAAIAWHELTHCLQFEREPAKFEAVDTAALQESSVKEYSEFPYEREAYLNMINVKWCQPVRAC